MRAFAIAVLALVYLVAPAFAVNLKAEMPSTNISEAPNITKQPPVADRRTKECYMATDQEFFENVTKSFPGIAIQELKPEAVQKLITYLNKKRAEQKLWPLEADRFAFAYIKDKKGERMGYVLFKEGCVVPGGIGTMPPGDLANHFIDAGVHVEDIVRSGYVGA